VSAPAWSDLETLFHEALTRTPTERAAFLAERCAGRLDLQTHVEAMLRAHDEAAASALEMPAASPTRLKPGIHVGSYEVIAEIGAGGMGEVYRARDIRLRREVAIKILPPIFTSDPERAARFVREARLLAALNHPNIAAIYSIEERALILELVEGETLADRIARGPIPLPDALNLARQIADALEAAHEKGIIHRDLKPANIKITPGGTVKVLDFGLAKLNVPNVPNDPNDPNDSLTLAGTREGVILGTAAYMSPEQARGQVVDKRADIWAFGCVFYEMLTGRTAFPGATISDTIAAILDREPDWAALPANTPPVVRASLRRCLQKDRQRRLRDIGDARLEIEETVAPLGPGAVSAQTVAPRRRERLAWAVALISLMAVAIAATGYFRSNTADTRVFRSSIVPPAGGNIPAVVVPSARFALSPDGRRLAFVGAENPQATLVEILAGGVTRLWVQSLDGLEARPLAGTEGAVGPFWSPDSRFIGFRTGGKLKRIDPAGGPPLTLADAGGTHAGTWNRDGVILFSMVGVGNPIRKVSMSGGPSTPVTALNAENGETQHWDPFFLPDDRHFLYLAIGTKASPISPNGIYVTALDSSERKLLVPGGSNAMYAQGHLFFLRGQTLVAQPFDVERLEFTGNAVTIAEQVTAGGGSGMRGAFTVSEAGVLAYQTGSADIGGNAELVSQLVWFDRSGKPIGTLGDRARFTNAELAPDGRRVTVMVFDPALRTHDLWLVDVTRGLRTRFTFDPGDEISSVWSPDGSEIAFSAEGKGRGNLYLRASNGAGTEEELEADGLSNPLDWSPDGRFLLFSDSAPNQASDLWILPRFGDRKPFPFLKTPFSEARGRFSPDGRWIAYVSNESGKNEVYVAPFLESSRARTASAPVTAGGKWQVSVAGGAWPRWRRDGREMFYLALDNKLMVAAVNGQGSAFEVDAVRPLFDARVVPNQGFSMYDVSADGQRFLINTPAEESPPAPTPITLVVNWAAGLKR
jgi:Tol biopolymer transport system component